MGYKVKGEFNWSARMVIFSGDIYILAGLVLVGIALYLLRADPNEVDKERKKFFDKLYAEDARRHSRQ